MINKYFINIYSGYFFYYYDIFNVKYNTKTINFKFIKKGEISTCEWNIRNFYWTNSKHDYKSEYFSRNSE